MIVRDHHDHLFSFLWPRFPLTTLITCKSTVSPLNFTHSFIYSRRRKNARRKETSLSSTAATFCFTYSQQNKHGLCNVINCQNCRTVFPLFPLFYIFYEDDVVWSDQGIFHEQSFFIHIHTQVLNSPFFRVPFFPTSCEDDKKTTEVDGKILFNKMKKISFLPSLTEA